MTYKLLLADDSVTIQKVVELTFADEDFEIISVGDGKAAFEKIKSEKPDIVLSDVIMPGLNGYELCEKVKQEAELQKTPFLFLKGTFESFDEGRAAEVGADGFIVKPFESQELIDRVKELVERYRGEAAPEEQPAPEALEEEAFLDVQEEAVLEEFPEEIPEEIPASEAVPREEEIEAGLGEGVGITETSEAESVTEEDLWSEVKISDHPIPEVTSETEFEQRVPPVSEEAIVEEQPLIEEVQPEEEEAEVLEEAVVEAQEKFAEEQPPVVEPVAPQAEGEQFEAPDFEVIEEPVTSPAAAPEAAQGAEMEGVPTEVVEKVLAAKIEEILRDTAPAIIREVTQKVISDVVWEVVPETAEKLIKAEINRITGGETQ